MRVPDLTVLFYILCGVIGVSLPLAIWKVYDIIVWLSNHINIV